MARHYFGTDLTIATAAGTNVTGGRTGVYARNYYTSGATTITVAGDVTGQGLNPVFGGDGIYALNNPGKIDPINILQPSGTIRSNGLSADSFAVDIENGPGLVTTAGRILGGGGGAIQFEQDGDGFADRLEPQPGSEITGLVFAGPNTDTFVLGGDTGSQSFDVSLLDADDTPEPGEQFLSFEVFEKEDASTWTLTGNNEEITLFSVNGGTLLVDGTLPNAAFPVASEAILGGNGTVGSIEALAGSRVQPGDPDNQFGTLNVTGDVVFRDDSTFGVVVDAEGNNNRLVADGAVTIEGGPSMFMACPAYLPTTSNTRSSLHQA